MLNYIHINSKSNELWRITSIEIDKNPITRNIYVNTNDGNKCFLGKYICSVKSIDGDRHYWELEDGNDKNTRIRIIATTDDDANVIKFQTYKFS